VIGITVTAAGYGMHGKLPVKPVELWSCGASVYGCSHFAYKAPNQPSLEKVFTIAILKKDPFWSRR
jgi:hypothetical protein